MSRRLLEITPQYSSFVDDQVLTSAKLNEFMEYFDEQDRLSRVCLTGVGVACGFTIDYNATASEITVHQGCGITTDGDLIKLQKDVPIEEGTPTGNSFKDIHKMVTSINYTHSKLFIDDESLYAPFRDGESLINMQELVSDEDASEDTDAIALSPAVLADKVVVLYLECYEKDADICTTTNCDNQGQPNIQNVKVLLIDKNDVENVVNSEDSIFNKHNVYETILALPRTAVQRVVLNASGGGQNNILSYTKLANAYTTKITNAKNQLNAAFSGLFLGFSEILDIPNGVSNTVLNQIDDLDNFTNQSRVQYRYALTKNVSDTFNEIADLLLQLKTECCPDIEAFPKHLLLGCLESSKVYPELRHDFYHAPVNNGYESIIRQVKSLVRRVRFMLDNFALTNTEDMQITPSLSCGPLGSKAIPVYFDIDEPLLKAWDYSKTENFKQQYNLSFHKSLLAPGSWVQNPLNFELDCTDLYRIEGHFGVAPSQSKSFIDSVKAEKGLDFDCLMFDIVNDIEEFSAFVRDNPSITHKGGVEKGGTFVLLTDAEEVLADFSVSYKIAEETTGIGCCKLVECSFPWISSLKYINNLSRSTRGTQSKKVVMPQEYVLTILNYKINGQPLISSQQTIRVPLEEVFLRRMHAVTAALNNTFPEGVVFDFNEDQKRLLVTKAKDDTFSIRLTENSMNSDNPVYSYSNNGMFKDDKVFRPKSMICRDIDGAKSSFYRSLHNLYAPSVTKDDDYGSYDDKWERWFELIHRELPEHSHFANGGNPRFKKSKRDFSGNSLTKLNDIISDIENVNEEAHISIDGDWVNGAWVDTGMLTYYEENKDDTKDSLVQFMLLRELLHEKSKLKATKFSIYIENLPYSKDYDNLIAEHCYDADFYFGQATGKNNFKL